MTGRRIFGWDFLRVWGIFLLFEGFSQLMNTLDDFLHIRSERIPSMMNKW